jgi:adenylate cyclase
MCASLTSSALPQATLRFQGADPEGRKFGFNLKFDKLLEKLEGLVIGRDFECDGVLAHSTVSHDMSALVIADDILQIEDLGSTNGTAVDGAVVAAGTRQPLPTGAKLRIGDIELAFRYD